MGSTILEINYDRRAGLNFKYQLNNIVRQESFESSPVYIIKG